MKERKPLLWGFLGVIGTLSVSWIGSYIYSVTNMEGGMTDILTSLKDYYINYPFEYAVSRDQMPFFTHYGYIIGSFMVGPSITLLYVALKREQKIRIEIVSIISLFLVGCGVILVNLPLSSRFESVHRTKNNIEIIRPYISEEEYQNFESQFLQIKTKNEYELVKKEIEKIVMDKNLSLQ